MNKSTIQCIFLVYDFHKNRVDIFAYKAIDLLGQLHANHSCKMKIILLFNKSVL